MMSFNCMIFIFHIGQRTTWMKVMGTKYSKGSIIITGLTYGNPVLGEVIRILISDHTLGKNVCKIANSKCPNFLPSVRKLTGDW